MTILQERAGPPSRRPAVTAPRRPRRWHPLRLLLVVVLALPLAVAARVVHVAGRDERPAADVIVVLGAAASDGFPGRVLQARLEQARLLHAEGVAPVVVTAGGAGAGESVSEAEAGRRWLVGMGVAESSVVAVGEGDDTLSSLRAVSAAAAVAGWDSVVLVSDPWHVYRSRMMAGDVGLAVAGTSPTRTGPNVELRRRAVFNVVRETVAVLAYRVETWSAPARRVAGALAGAVTG